MDTLKMGRIKKSKMMKLSIKKMFSVLLILAVFSSITLGGISLYFNSRLAKNQHNLMEATTIETARYSMINAISKFLSNEKNTLIASKIEDISALKQNVFDQQFKTGLTDLSTVTDNHSEIIPTLQALKSAYHQFLISDQQLRNVITSRLMIRLQLKKLSQLVDQEIESVRSQAEEINGILILDNKKNENKIKNDLQNKALLATTPGIESFKIEVSTFLSSLTDAKINSNKLNTNFAALSILMHEIVEETDSDRLTSLVNNQLVQRIQSIHQVLEQLKSELESTPDLYQLTVDISNQFDTIVSQLIKGPHNIIHFRKSLNDNQIAVERTINHIQKTQIGMSIQLDALNTVASTLRNTLLARSAQFNKTNRFMIISMVTIIILAMIALGYYVLQAITTSLNMLTNAMKKIANEEESLTYRLPETGYDDLNELSQSFNTMTSKLQYIHEHLQELVETKTHELSDSRNRINLRHNITSILVERSSLKEAAEKIIKIICESMQLTLGDLWKVSPNSKMLTFGYYWSSGEETKEFVKINKKMTLSLGEDLPGKVWLGKMPAFIEDVAKDPNFPRTEIAEKANLHSAFAFPIKFREEVLYVMEFFSNKILHLDDETMVMLNDISHSMSIFVEREEHQKEVELLLRQAGMSEVATSVLHNVGNILNSIITSIHVLRDNTNSARLDSLKKAIQLIQDHSDNLAYYLTEDEKGKLILPYIISVEESIRESNNKSKDEISDLEKHINHVQEIVAMQQPLSGLSNVNEKVLLSDVIETAIQMCRSFFKNKNIQIKMELQDNPTFITDKSKLLQILVNLIKNASDALSAEAIKDQDKIVIIKSKKHASNKLIDIIVQDNGVGILPQHLTKIFSLGFTTKSGGHGFGLHMSAVSASEMKGKLQAKSEGQGCGTEFILTLPLDNLAHEFA